MFNQDGDVKEEAMPDGAERTTPEAAANPLRVYIIGAGASIAHTDGALPTTNGIFGKAKELGISCSGDRTVAQRFQPLQQFLRAHFGLSLANKGAAIDAEALYTFLEIELERGQSTEVETVRRRLIELIVETIAKGSGRFNENATQNGGYELLQQRLDLNSIVVSFNWDTLLDDLLGRRIDPNPYKPWVTTVQDGLPSIFYDRLYSRFFYGGHQTMDRAQAAAPEPPELAERMGRATLLKLHGSVDWRYCTNQQCSLERAVFPVPDPLVRWRCSECGFEVKPLLVPPTLNKQYGGYPIVRGIWQAAYTAMTKASELVIWGYSLPPTDFQASWLLSCARSDHLSSVVVVNPAAWNRGGDPNYRFRGRFTKLFKGVLRTGDFRWYRSFSEYVQGNAQ